MDYIVTIATSVIGVFTGIISLIILIRRSFADKTDRLKLASEIDRNLESGRGNCELAELVGRLYAVKLGRAQMEQVMAHPNPALVLYLLRNCSGLVEIDENGISLKPGKDHVLTHGIWVMKSVISLCLIEALLICYVVSMGLLPMPIYLVLGVILLMCCVTLAHAFEEISKFKSIENAIKIR